MSTTPTTPQWADFLFRKWVSDPANNGEYQLHLGPPFVCFSCGTDGTPLYCPNCAKGLAQREPGDSELAKELRDMLAELSDVCDGNYYELVKSAKALINRYDKSAQRGEGKP